MPQEHLTDLWAYADAPNASPLSAKGRAAALALLVAQGHYTEAYTSIRADKTLTDAEKRTVQKEISQKILFARDLEWTGHGVVKTFRFWQPEQKIKYMKMANSLASALQDFTPYVAFGFGSVLSMIRDNDFIPHDDDLDLIIALDPSTFGDAKQRLQTFLEGRGFTCYGKNLSHFGVNTGTNETAVDVFIGFIEDDRVSWFPSRRGGLDFAVVFPVQHREFFGQMAPIPADPERYLAVTYGPDWREPISNWNHPWDASEYHDFR